MIETFLYRSNSINLMGNHKLIRDNLMQKDTQSKQTTMINRSLIQKVISN